MREEPPTDLQALWQAQPGEPPRFSVDEIRAKANSFQRKIRARNLREHLAAAFVVVWFGRAAWNADTWLGRAGPALIVLGTLYIVFQLATRGAARRIPGGDAPLAASCAQFHRRELERQRDLLRDVWRWYLGPLVPGLLVVYAERALEAWPKGGTEILAVLGSLAVSALVFGVIGWLNARASRRLQAQIDALGPADETGDG